MTTNKQETMGTTEARSLVIRANDGYLEGSLTRGQRNADLRLIAKVAGYSFDEAGVAALISDLFGSPMSTLTAPDLFDQMADWEGAPPARLCTLPLRDLTADVMDFLDGALPFEDGSVWVRVDLRELAHIAANVAEDFRRTTGESPW